MRWRPNRRFDHDMGLETAGYVQRRTRRARDTAEAAAPVRSGDYRRSLRVVDEPTGATLYTDDWAGHLVEWGSPTQRAHRVITNAAIDEADRVDIL